MNLPPWPTLPPETSAPAAAPRGLTHRRGAAARPSGLTLPDGRPLLLTISRKSLYVQLTMSLAIDLPENALLLLYLASPDFDPGAVWQAPEPADTPEPDMKAEQPNLYIEIRRRAEEWADEQFDHTQLLPMWDLARALWNGQHVTATQPVEDPTAAAPEKKSAGDACPTGVSSTSASSAEATSPAGISSSTDSPCATPTPPSTHGV